MEALLKFVQDEFVTKKEFADFAAGDTITVYYEIKEGEKVRTQFFRGVVIQRRGAGTSETFTIRKMSGTVGVERIFPVNLPSIQKIEINKKGRVRELVFSTLEVLLVKKLELLKKGDKFFLLKNIKKLCEYSQSFFHEQMLITVVDILLISNFLKIIRI